MNDSLTGKEKESKGEEPRGEESKGEESKGEELKGEELKDKEPKGEQSEQSNNECVICLDKSDKLIYNKRCKCKYYYHDECWKNLYIQNKCLLCNIMYDEIIFIQNPITVQRIERNQERAFNNDHTCAMCCFTFFCLILCAIALIAFLLGSR
jgi:hypothetical protein